MKVIKVFAIITVLLVVLVGGVGVYLFSQINAIVKQLVESEGPKVTQTTVALDEVDLNVFQGKGELKKFKIGNPTGFDSEYLLKWDSILLQIDPQSVKKDVIVIKDFAIDGVNIKVEQKGSTTNIQELLKTLSGDSAKEEPVEEGGDAKPIKLVMSHVKFANNSIDLITEEFGTHKVKLPGFELNNIGDPNIGLTPQEMGVAILKPLMKKAKEAAEDRVKGIAKEELEAKLKEKKAELKAKAKEKEAELKTKADEKLQGKEAELKEKVDKSLDEKDKEKLKKLKELF